MSEYKIIPEANGTKADIITPYNADFVKKVKLLGGRWNPSKRCWTVELDALDDVRAAMRSIYGQDDAPVGDAADVILRFDVEVEEWRGPVTLLGRTIASAFGRDTGAKVGEGVLFLERNPQSGGSSKYWTTVIPKGAVVKLLRVPAAMIQQAELPEGVTMEVVGTHIDREALEAEKARLMARIAEIDEILKGDLHGQ